MRLLLVLEREQFMAVHTPACQRPPALISNCPRNEWIDTSMNPQEIRCVDRGHFKFEGSRDVKIISALNQTHHLEHAAAKKLVSLPGPKLQRQKNSSTKRTAHLGTGSNIYQPIQRNSPAATRTARKQIYKDKQAPLVI